MKQLLKAWLPPAIISLRRRWQESTDFEGGYSSWQEALAHCTGYDAKEILDRVLAATLKVKRGEAAFERDSALFEEIEHVWPVLAGLMLAASRNGGRLVVMDFGGALGSSYFQNRQFLQLLSGVLWNVVEQPHYVEAGRRHIQDDQLRFYGSIEECIAESPPNVILLSSVLQYLPDPGSRLIDLMSVGSDAIVIDRTIVNPSSSDRIYVQHVPASIYSASYPCWSLSEPALFSALSESGYLALADFPSLDFPALSLIGSEFKGYIFIRAR